jgi:Fe-S-cluster containining protein
MEKLAQCQRTGECCKRLHADQFIEFAHKFLKRRYRKDYPNTKPRISKAWLEDAEKAREIGRQTFPCRFLTDGNTCSLQDKKPEVCSWSLSTEVLSEGINPGTFFHKSCGYLEGAPEKLIKLVYLISKYYAKKDGGPDYTNEDYEKLLRLYNRIEKLKADPEVKGWKIINGKWEKEK